MSIEMWAYQMRKVRQKPNSNLKRFGIVFLSSNLHSLVQVAYPDQWSLISSSLCGACGISCYPFGCLDCSGYFQQSRSRFQVCRCQLTRRGVSCASQILWVWSRRWCFSHWLGNYFDSVAPRCLWHLKFRVLHFDPSQSRIVTIFSFS